MERRCRRRPWGTRHDPVGHAGGGPVLQGQDAHPDRQLRGRRQHRHRGEDPGAPPAETYRGRSDHHHPEHARRRRPARHEPAGPQHQVTRRRLDRRLLHDQPDRAADRRSRAQDQHVRGLPADRRRDRMDRRLCAQGYAARTAAAGRHRQGDEGLFRRLQPRRVARHQDPARARGDELARTRPSPASPPPATSTRRSSRTRST